MNIIKDLLKNEKKDCLCRGIFSFLFLIFTTALIYVIYKTVDLNCHCSFHCDCKGKCAGKNLDIDKDWTNSENKNESLDNQDF